MTTVGRVFVVDKATGNVTASDIPPWMSKGQIAFQGYQCDGKKLLGSIVQTGAFLSLTPETAAHETLLVGPWRNQTQLLRHPASGLYYFSDSDYHGNIWQVDVSAKTARPLLAEPTEFFVNYNGTGIDATHFYFITERDTLTSAGPRGLLRVKLP